MAITSVKIMQCVLAKEGQLKIDCVGVGVGIMLHRPRKKVAAGLHVLAPHSATQTPDNPAKFADSAIPHAVDMMEKEGLVGPLSGSKGREVLVPEHYFEEVDETLDHDEVI